MPLQNGMTLFNQYCASCHNFSENGIGPNLTGITSEVDKQWIIDFIHNPTKMIEAGDPRALAGFEKYKQHMPAFAMIQGEDMEDILSFIHKFSQGERRNAKKRPGGIINPIPEKIPAAALTLVLEEQFTAPQSSEVPPITRINKMDVGTGNRVFIHDIRGKLYEVGQDKALTEYLDVSTRLPNFIDNPGKGSGLAYWVFHPDFETNGLLYTSHTESAGSAPADYAYADSIKVTLQSVLLEWKASNPASPQFEGTYRELLRVDMVSAGHTFQDITFNPLAKPSTPDYGMLYLGIGDGGAAVRGYPFLCDNIKRVWSNILRIDPLGSNSDNGQYGIPPDNPFVNVPDALGEIWARGFRNPHRIVWDETGSGKMLITNIGQHSLEEVNLGKAGADYGWPYREGRFVFDPEANHELVYPLPEEGDDYSYPVIEYDHDEASAVAGGFVYQGESIPLLKGKYVFGDISLGTLFYSNIDEIVEGQRAPIYRLDVALNGESSDMETITGSRRVDLRIGKDAAGELYLLTKSNGSVYKVIDCKRAEAI